MIRFATSADIPAILTLMDGEYAELKGPLRGLDFDRERTRQVLEKELDARKLDFILVSDVEGELRGMLWFVIGDFVPWSSSLVAIDQIVYVRPEYRGGYTAAALAKRYTKEAQALGAKAAYLTTSSGINEDATCAFYQAVGFEAAGKQTMRRLG